MRTLAFARAWRLWGEGVTDANTHFGGFLKLEAMLAQHDVTVRGKRVLDVGCGDRAPLSLMFALRGAEVDAIDISPVYVGWKRRPLMLAALMRENPGRALKQALRDVLHTWRYWRSLAGHAGRHLPFGEVRLHQMDAERLAFPDDTFDIVVSSAVWEHVADVKAATREVNRVLRPDGLAIVSIGLFPSLQGGHYAEWHSVEESSRRSVRPWEHLRRDGRPPPCFLYEWREAQYREVFEREMHVVNWEEGSPRGKEYLTIELAGELQAYDQRDLLLPYVTAWCGKKQRPTATPTAGPAER